MSFATTFQAKMSSNDESNARIEFYIPKLVPLEVLQVHVM